MVHDLLDLRDYPEAVFQRLSNLEMEISTSCNAACPSCARQLEDGSPSPFYSKNQHLALDIIQKLCDSPRLQSLNGILLCGNYGDPMAHPQKLPLIETLRRAFPKACLVIHTNGGLGTREEWKTLGEMLSGTSHKVHFSIDGLADTLPVYRRKVSYDKLMENARAFISAGGRASWKWIDFHHTRHQISEARELATKLGFREFVIRNDHSDFRPETSSVAIRPHSDLEFYPSGTNFPESQCRSKTEELLYVDVHGKVWPCCWMADGLGAREAAKRLALNNDLPKNFPEFNNLGHVSLETVLEHPFFQKTIPSAWNAPKPTNCGRICLYHCAGIGPSVRA
jgi:hypothetical protein